MTYDLTGLPPTPAEVQSFLDDKSPKAYEQLVDRLLASKAYGERWGRMWLDVVRYADTSGGGGDYPIPQAAKYRDYVIQSFIDDKPYDRFIREQIAGDLLPSQSEPEHWQNIVATGYLAGTNRYEDKPVDVSDAVDNLGSAFLGVTVGCARCHDHKFDPIPTADYYALYGILHSTNYAHPGDDEVRYQKDFTYRDPEALKREDWKIFQKQLKPIQDAIDAVLQLPGTYDDLLPQLEARRMHLFEHMPDLGESAYAVTEGTPEDAKIQHLWRPRNLGEQGPARLSAGFGRLRSSARCQRQRPAGTRELDCEQGQSAHRPRDGESHLAGAFRTRHRRHAERFRQRVAWLPAIRRCSTIWLGNLSIAAGRSKPSSARFCSRTPISCRRRTPRRTRKSIRTTPSSGGIRAPGSTPKRFAIRC